MYSFICLFIQQRLTDCLLDVSIEDMSPVYPDKAGGDELDWLGLMWGGLPEEGTWQTRHGGEWGARQPQEGGGEALQAEGSVCVEARGERGREAHKKTLK